MPNAPYIVQCQYCGKEITGAKPREVKRRVAQHERNCPAACSTAA